jgi:hypothetical protein
MSASKLHGLFLERQKKVPDFMRYFELFDALASILRQVPSHLEIDVIGRTQLLASPAFFDDGDELLGDVQATRILPTIFEPTLKFFGRIFI